MKLYKCRWKTIHYDCDVEQDPLYIVAEDTDDADSKALNGIMERAPYYDTEYKLEEVSEVIIC